MIFLADKLTHYLTAAVIFCRFCSSTTSRNPFNYKFKIVEHSTLTYIRDKAFEKPCQEYSTSNPRGVAGRDSITIPVKDSSTSGTRPCLREPWLSPNQHPGRKPCPKPNFPSLHIHFPINPVLYPFSKPFSQRGELRLYTPLQTMANLKTNGCVPQVGRPKTGKSHTFMKVSLEDSGGGKNSQIQPISKNKAKIKLHIATYNIRTMRLSEHLEELEEELAHIKWNILGLSETRLREEKCTELKSQHLLYQNNKDEDSHIGGVAILIHKNIKHLVTKMKSVSHRVIYIILKISERYSVQIIQVYAPTSSASEEDIENFYEDISRATASEKTHYKFIIGDFNAKLGVKTDNRNNSKYVGNFGLGLINERGERLMHYLDGEKMYCMNTFFKKQTKRRWTWISPDSKTKNEIDYILTNQKHAVKDVSVLNHFNTGSDHRLIRAKIEINSKSERKKLIKNQRFPVEKIIQENIQKYQNDLKSKLSNKELLNQMDINKLETKIKTDIKTAMKKTCSTARKPRQTKISKETKDLMDKRRKMIKGTPEHKELNKIIKTKTRDDLRHYNTELVKTVIENNKNMKVLKTINTKGRLRIHQLKDANGNTTEEKSDLINITENFYSTLYQETIPKPPEADNRKILNVGSEELLDITIEEIQLALSQMKNKRAPGDDGVTSEMMKLGGTATIESITILLNKCLTQGIIPETWQNAQVILLHKKGDKLKIENYRPISLLPHPYKLLTRIITNRLTNKLDDYQPAEQAGFRKGFSTIEHIQSIRSLVEKCNEYNEPLHLAFVDYNKAFDSVELWAIFEALNNARVDSRYKDLLKNIYNNATSIIKIADDIETNRIPIKRGVRQGDTISPKLFTLALEDVFKTLEWDRKGIRIDGRYLNHLRFADDVVLISQDVGELQEMLEELRVASERIGLTMNLSKTKIMTAVDNIVMRLGNQVIEKVEDYVYLGHIIKLGKENQTAEINRRVRQTWAATGKLSHILKDKNIPINLKRKVFNTCILPVMTYGMETTTLTIKSANTLRTTQRAIERMMLGLSLRDHTTNTEIRQRTKVEDIITRIAKLKWSWVGHVARQNESRWTKRIIQWRPRLHKRSVGRPQKRWLDDVKESVGRAWHQIAQDKEAWKLAGEAYVQEWTAKGC